jgi:ATP-dependent RNA circularization protein (DNA/RNA ligase family)
MKGHYCQDDNSPHVRRHPFWRRRFLTEEEKKELKERYKEKKIEWITRYKESLENELKGVTERLNELTKETD